MNALTARERDEIAALCGLNPQWLYQCMTGRADLSATKASRVERISGYRVRRWQLRRDWFETWPELVGTEGAPEVPAAAEGAHAT